MKDLILLSYPQLGDRNKRLISIYQFQLRSSWPQDSKATLDEIHRVQNEMKKRCRNFPLNYKPQKKEIHPSPIIIQPSKNMFMKILNWI